ncbi:type I-B CRISPR-associated endonuclease Cas1b [Fervidibacillus albus]|uniref:CRISPR-associated endonuclease Cas1 n=1 Tax=Fervidibacillus albus TaxID=2980026 RepID=A0A9E8LUD9_9BACI|nr:type I-B CRISPR-associated endonuclease Cas1b [Fervidibacillus albus]WAA09835.1 type I-B CRISPR-associated endonuclease Cas1b [Fervidibacillus albus]
MKKTLYIFNNGQLRRKDNSLYFETEEKRKYIPVEDTNDIYIFGEVDVSKRFLEFVSQKEICLHYFNHYGYYIGTFYPREHLNSGHVTVKQVEHYLDKTKRMQLAQTFVEGSIEQMKQVLKYYRNRSMESQSISEILKSLLVYLEDLQGNDMKNIDELMSIEGHAREKYYQSFDLIINHQDFVFEKRSRRPPLNRLNALISFGNSMLYTIVLSEIYKTYLDPRIGFLHTSNFRRFSLDLDIAEIFKPILVDRLIFSLINKKVLTKKHFEKLINGIVLNDKGRKLFVEEFDKRLKATVSHRHLGKTVSYRRLIRLEAYKLQKHLLEEKKYIPYQSLW